MGFMATDEFDNNSPLTPTEQLDSDEVRNDDGDEVVDPPEEWLDPEEHDTLDDRLAEEVPDVSADSIDARDADDSVDETVLAPNDQVDPVE